MLLSFKTRIKLTQEQINLLDTASNEARLLYNKLLEEKISYFKTNNKYLNYFTQQKELKNIECKLLTYDAKKEVLRTLEANFKSYFGLLKKRKELNPNPPRFRSKKYFFTLSCVQSFIIKDNTVIISLLNKKYLKIELDYFTPIVDLLCKRNKSQSQIKQLKIFKKDNKFFASIAYEKQEKVSSSKNYIAIDLGKKNLATVFDPQNNSGTIFNSKQLSKNQKHLDKRIDEVKSLRDKKQENSRRRNKLDYKLKKLYSKKRTQTNLILHKLSRELAKQDANIIIGELSNLKHNIKEKRNRKLNRAMQNNWLLATFIRLLEYKTLLIGNKVIKVNEAWTSKTCCKCGTINHDLQLSDREYNCECGNSINRDLNGAINIWKQYLGDYDTPIETESLSVSEMFAWGDFKRMNEKSV